MRHQLAIGQSLSAGAIAVISLLSCITLLVLVATALDYYRASSVPQTLSLQTADGAEPQVCIMSKRLFLL